MALLVKCPNSACGKSAKISDDLVGKTLRCTHCGEKFRAASASDNCETASASKKASLSSVRGPASDSTLAARETKPASAHTALPDTPKGIGRFEIRTKLGSGAFGTVYRAFDPQLEREVALKVPRAGTLDSPKAIERFLREAKSAAQLRHPHIVPIYDAGRDGDHDYIASAFIQGRTLAEAIDEGQLDFRRAAEIVRELAEALAYAHSLVLCHSSFDGCYLSCSRLWKTDLPRRVSWRSVIE